LIAGTGCYTVLRHPTGSDIVQEGSYYRSCSDCHADAAYYHPYGNSYYNYGRSSYGWGGYYGQPWWYDDYWWWDHDHGDDDYDGPRVETGQRHLWSTDGWAPQGWGFSRPESGTQLTPSTPSTPSTPTEQPKEKEKKKEAQMKDQPKKDDKKSEDKDKRDLWDAPKRGF
ncbi:MAG: hypothetical protein JXB46_05970, partial [Candidatus Eisenbacteria bacterium]|nr:hypothetical protein [Candidatus Eisenbacteria bacterium]